MDTQLRKTWLGTGGGLTAAKFWVQPSHLWESGMFFGQRIKGKHTPLCVKMWPLPPLFIFPGNSASVSRMVTRWDQPLGDRSMESGFSHHKITSSAKHELPFLASVSLGLDCRVISAGSLSLVDIKIRGTLGIWQKGVWEAKSWALEGGGLEEEI